MAEAMGTAVASMTMAERRGLQEPPALCVASMTMAEKRGLQEPPALCVPGEGDGPISSDSSKHALASIPVVDLRLLSQSDGNSQEMEKLRSALTSWGLFQATGHGFPTSFLDEVRNTGTQFFQLPMEEKQKYPRTGEQFFEGYGSDDVDPEAHIIERTDRLHLLVEPEDQRKLELWPDNPSTFRETLHEYSVKAKTVAHLVLQAMAKCLELDATHLVDQFEGKMRTYCRFSHYPCCPGPDLTYGFRPHSDNSLFTVIAEGGDVEGLELLKDDVWIKVPNIPDVLTIQMGDLMEIVSNGMFKSAVHRVVAHPGKERTSVATFYGLDPEVKIEPEERLLKEGKPRLYRDLKVKDYLDAHFESFLKGERSINWAKV